MAIGGADNENMKVELFEYGYLVEDTDPTAKVFKVYVPKLMGNKTGGAGTSNSSVDNSAFANGSEAGGSAGTKDYIECRVQDEIMIAHRHKHHDCPGNCINEVHTAQTCHPGTSTLKPCHHYHHDHHWPHVGDLGKIPANSRVIILFMNHNINDGIVTRLECKFPAGGEPEPPREGHKPLG